MPRPTRYNPHKSPYRRYWIYTGVIAFILVDVVLVVWALSVRTEVTAAEPSRPVPTFTTDKTTMTPTPAPVVSTVAVPSIRLLSALDADTAWRATTGECPAAAAAPELTTDAGATWKGTDATGDVQVTALQSLHVVSNTLVELTGLAAADCAPQFVKSFVAGDDYASYPKELASRWYVDPAERSIVHTPDGDVAAPCSSVVALAPRTDVANEAAVLCDDTRVFITEDSAGSWSDPVQAPGAVNLAVTSVGYLVASVGLPECAGVQLVAMSARSSTATPTGCVPVDAPKEAMPGNVAISEASGTVWLWAGTVLRRSSDGGVTWL